MTTEHVSDLTWDRQLAGELPAPLVERARQHAIGCAQCAARCAQLEAEQRDFRASRPPLAPGASAPQTPRNDGAAPPLDDAAPAIRRPPWLRMRWAIPALAAAAAAVLVVPRIARDRSRAPFEPTTRSKGGFAATAFAGRNGDVVALGAGDPVFPGDRLQLSYSAERDGHLAVLAIDGAGTVGVYFPPDGVTTWPAAAGQRIALPSSTALDDVVGEERLWIVYCDRPQALPPLAGRLSAEGVSAAPPVGCEVERLSFLKRVRAGSDPR